MTGLREKHNAEPSSLQRRMLKGAIDTKIGEMQTQIQKGHNIAVPTTDLLEFLDWYKAAKNEEERPLEEQKVKAPEKPKEIYDLLYRDLILKLAPDDQSKAALMASERKSFEFIPILKSGEKKIAMLGTPGNEGDERPRQVTLTKPFEIQSTPVTQIQYAAVMGKNPSRYKNNSRLVSLNGIQVDPNLPVEWVTLDEILKFIERLNEHNLIFRYRLPTEAEWEFSVRAGTDTSHFFGDDPGQIFDYAWIFSNSGGGTRPVGEKKPNPYGLYDVYGNVWEWVEDSYVEKPPGGTDPVVNLGDGFRRVLRGGNWNGMPEDARSANRGNSFPDAAGSYGLRLVRELK